MRVRRFAARRRSCTKHAPQQQQQQPFPPPPVSDLYCDVLTVTLLYRRENPSR